MASTEQPITHAIPPILRPRAREDGLVVNELRVENFDVPVQTTEELRQRVKDEFSEIVKILCSEGRLAFSTQPSDAPGKVAVVEFIKQTTPNRARPASLALTLGPGTPPLHDQKIRKERRLAAEHLAKKVEELARSNAELKQSAEERKLTAKELAKKVEELARSNAELEQFAYVASHDLQEPLRMVANYTQLLAERYSGKLDVQADKYMRYAADGAARMQALILDLLAFSRAGGSADGLKSSDCRGVVEQALKNLQVAIEDSGAVVTFEDLPVVMSGAIQLEQVFQNLIGNAIKFCGTKAPVIQIAAQRKEAEWVFSVSDNGIDIAPENAEVIFAIFQRLHSREEYAGNGIGLAICKKIVEQHGGKIWVEPQTAPGATFKFTWPAIAAEQSA